MKTEIIEKVYTLITTASAFIVALAWNSTILKIFNRYYSEEIVPLLIYAILVTIIAIFLTIWVGRISAKNAEKVGEKQD